MQLRHVLAICGTTFAVLTASVSYAQTTPAADDGTAASEMGAPNKKQMRAADRMLARAVRKSLTKVKGLDSSAITVLARDGKVTLDGTVPDENEVLSAVQAATATQGVTTVDNRLSMREAGH